MNSQDENYLKATFETLCDSLDAIEKLVPLPNNTGKSLRHLYKQDVISFLIYLSTSDGELTQNKCDRINSLLGLQTTIHEIDCFIKNYNIDDGEFEKRVPRSLQIASVFDEKKAQHLPPLLPGLINFFENSGMRLLQFDREFPRQKFTHYLYYINHLKARFLGKGIASNLNDVFDIPIPTKPKMGKGIILYTVALLILAWVFEFGAEMGLLLFLLCIPIICYGIIFWRKNCEYNLAQNNYPEYAKQVIDRVIAQGALEREKQVELDAEYQAAQASQNRTEPWAVRYSTSACPHCGHYKVRTAKWDDKRMSVAFWGVASDKIGKNYICDNCKSMW